jgi:colanic acid/amylovoran biosynthesis protein
VTKRVFFSGTVVSNGGDAAIYEAQRDLLDTVLGGITAVSADSAPDIAARQFPEDDVVPALWPWAKRGRAQFGRWTRLWQRALLARHLAAARLPTPRGDRLLTADERTSIAAIRDADLLAYAGGTSIIETYYVRPKLHELRVAKALGTPVVLMPASMGPYTDEHVAAEVRRVVDDATLVLLRDDRSRQHLADIGCLMINVQVVPDVVFWAARDAAVDRLRTGHLPDVMNVVVSVRDIAKFGRGETDAYRQAVADLVTELVRAGSRVRFLSTCQGVEGYRYDDSAVAVDIAGRLPADVADQVVVDRDWHTLEEMRAGFAAADLVVGTRMHACIMALDVGTPVLPIAYEFKTHEVMKQLGLGELVVDIDGITAERLRSSLATFRDGEETFRKSAANRIEWNRDMLRHAGRDLAARMGKPRP